MSYETNEAWDAATRTFDAWDEHTVVAPPPSYKRSLAGPLSFLLPVLISGVSYIAGGIPLITDLAFLTLTVLCVIFCFREMLKFSHRMGIGAILIYGGVLIWFCHDYMTNWFWHDFRQVNPFFDGVTPSVVARAAFYHCLFVDLMLVALRIPLARWVDRLVVIVPEPASGQFFLGLVIVVLLFGWSAFFAAEDPIYIAIPRGALWWILGPVKFNVWRTGNVNYNWGGYVAQIIQVGQIGGIIAAFYAISVARSLPGKVFGWCVWAYWFMFSLAGERRGEIAFMALPIIGLLFVRYHALATAQFRRYRIWAFAVTLAVSLAALYAVQWQTADRTNAEDVQLFRASGNTMFSEGLRAWGIIPEVHGYAEDEFPGETLIRPLPDTLWWFLVGPIPRALWHDKPTESFSLWYSGFISGDSRGVDTAGVAGTTVSGGAVGAWYFRYGPAGVIQGALLYGWLMGVAERALRRANGRPMALLFALAFATFMFRCYRDLWWHNLYPVMIAAVILWVLIRLFFSGERIHEAVAGEPIGTLSEA